MFCISVWCNGVKYFLFIIIILVKGIFNNVNVGGKLLGFICMVVLSLFFILGRKWVLMGRVVFLIDWLGGYYV